MDADKHLTKTRNEQETLIETVESEFFMNKEK